MRRGSWFLLATLVVALAGGGWWLLRSGSASRPAPARGELVPGGPGPGGPLGTASPGGLAAPGTALSRVDGSVRDALTGAPVGGVDVRFTADAGEVTATSDATGAFVTELAPGRYRVRALGDELVGFAPPLAVGSGAGVGGVVVRVARLARVDGQVVDGAGRPLTGVEVRFASTSPGGALDSEDVDGGLATTGAGGAFSLRVAPGDVMLTAAQGSARGRLRLPYVAPGAAVLAAQIVVDSGGAVAGVVRDGRGQAVAGATVAVAVDGTVEDRPRTVTSGPGGAFRLDGLPLGARVRVEAWAAGHAPGAPVVASVGDTTLTIMLRESLAVRGRVLDPSGAPLGGATITARRAGRGRLGLGLRPAPTVTTGADGGFALADLDPGPFDLVAEAPGYAALVRPGVGAPAEGVLLRLHPAGGLAGLIQDERGAPVTSFTITWRRQDEREHSSLAFAAADGAFRIEGLEAGPLVVLVAAPGHGPVERTVQVPAGAFADGSVRLPTAAVLSGRVLSATGAPVEGARVSLMSGHAGDEILTDATGRFELGDVAPGRRSLMVAAAGHVSRSETGLELGPGERRQVDVTLTPLAPGEGQGGAVPIEFAGIGASLQVHADGIVLNGVIPGGPAERAGLLAGDWIVAVDGQATQGRSLVEVTEQIRGVAGTVVRLLVRRDSTDRAFDVVRGTIRVGG